MGSATNILLVLASCAVFRSSLRCHTQRPEDPSCDTKSMLSVGLSLITLSSLWFWSRPRYA